MKTPKSGAGAHPKKAYYLLDVMQFTIPYLKSLGAPSGSLPNPPQQEDELVEVDYESNIPLTQQPMSSSSQTTPDITPTQVRSSGGKQSKRAIQDDVDRAFIDYLRNKTNRSPKEPKTEGMKMFLLSLLPDLSKMSEEQTRLFKRKTLGIIHDILSTQDTISPQFPHSRTPIDVAKPEDIEIVTIDTDTYYVDHESLDHI